MAPDSEAQQEQQQQQADGRHVEGPCDPAQQGAPVAITDAYGFTIEVTPEQAAILERCRAKSERLAAKWGPCTGSGGELAPTEALKKLCRKVWGWGDGGGGAVQWMWLGWVECNAQAAGLHCSCD